MTLHEACSFYGDYSMLLDEIAEELSLEKVDNTIVAATFFEDLGNTVEISVLNLESV